MVRAALLAMLIAGAAGAEEAPALRVELNTVEAQGAACRLTFVAANATGADLAGLVLETVLFTRAGRVAQFTLFDFGALPDGRRRVRQFDVAGVDCGDLGQVLFNGVARCEGADPAACAAALRPSSAVDGMEVAG
ncbi:MAG: hypothetical protein KF887_02665 [Paracoccaceae bacterium]|nr:MAG: hypothetical protein KF887_02665 [Paracoccaceae bacterium]